MTQELEGCKLNKTKYWQSIFSQATPILIYYKARMLVEAKNTADPLVQPIRISQRTSLRLLIKAVFGYMETIELKISSTLYRA